MYNYIYTALKEANMRKIRILSLIMCICFISTNVSASVLGSTLINGFTVNIGHGTTATHNTWYSDQQGVGQQTENYVIYNPNSNVEPIITHGEYLYGATKIDSEVSRIRQNNITPLAGVNADFFSFETGVPMSNIISEGKIITKTGSPQYGIGILENNNAFMSKFTLYSIMTKSDGTKMHIHMINKYRQPYAAYLLTNDFSAETRNKTKGYDVVLGSVSGEMKLGKSITATVESISENSKSISIPKNKMILTVDSKAPAEYLNPIKSLKVGEKITISFSVDGDERWKKVKLGLGATGDVLIENNQKKSGFTAGANPRTAIGIRNDGSILLYTIDGRQKGYSYGVQLKTLASRLKELGCVDAINLDGGGSTSYIIQFPGENITKLINKPSDGKLRSVSNFIFLKNNQKPTGTLGGITIYPLNVGITVNSSVKLTAKGYDTAFYPMEIPNLTFSVAEGFKSSVTKDGIFTAKENGTVTVYAKSGNVVGKINIICLQTPTNMKITKKSGEDITSISLNSGEKIDLSLIAYGGYNQLITTKDSINWSCDNNIGTIDNNGTFKAIKSLKKQTGKIYATVGQKKTEIPITVNTSGYIYNDINISTTNEILSVNITQYPDAIVNKDDIIIKVDGKKMYFEYSNNTAKSNIPENANKVTVYAKNSLGYTTFVTKTVSDAKYTNPFNDTEKYSAWAKDILSYMYSIKIINGEKIGNKLNFNPNKYMTRAEFAVMITNYLGINSNNYANVNLPYADNNKIPKWALNSFKALYTLGIMKGSYENQKLYVYPLNNITRAETVTTIYRTLPGGLKKSPINYSDKNTVPEWSKDAFMTLINIGAISGYENGTLLPKRNVTKAEAVKILYSVI